MKVLIWSLAVFLALVIQGRMSLLGVHPNLTSLIAYYAGIRYGETRGLLTGVLVGALEDGLSFSILGPNLLGKGLIGFFSSFFVTGSILRWTPALGLVAVTGLTFLGNWLTFLSLSMFHTPPASVPSALVITTMQALLNAPAGLFLRPHHAD